MKFWISKYALTQGIFEIDAKEYENGMIEEIKKGNNIISNFYHGEDKDWHRTKEDAIKRAEEMKNKKIKSLEKQLEKIKNLKFE